MSKIKKWPAMDPERLNKIQDYWENGRSADGIDPAIQEHLARMKTMGGGKGIEFLSILNKGKLFAIKNI